MTARAITVMSGAAAPEAEDTVTLAHDRRHRRRMAMTSDAGQPFVLDLPDAVALRDGDVLALDDGSHVRVVAEAEPVLEITAPDTDTLVRIAWHIGNRHLAAELHAHHIVIASDHVIADMVTGLGGTATPAERPFQPEGGAYSGHGH
ncbi:MAG: urease accessory protein UreE [Pseudomonadota bacterium]